MSKAASKTSNESQNNETQFVRKPLTSEDVEKRVQEAQTNKLREGEEIRGTYMGAFEVETQFGPSVQHAFQPEGAPTGTKPVYYWSNWSMDKAITDANLQVMDVCHIRRFPNNVYVVDVVE